jgi:hypothetical protein
MHLADKSLAIPDFETVELRREQDLGLPDQVIIGTGTERRQALDPGASQEIAEHAAMMKIEGKIQAAPDATSGCRS